MDANYLTFIVSVLAVGGIAFTYTWLQTRAYERKWGKRPPAE